MRERDPGAGHWARVDALFRQALDLSEEERSAFLLREADGDPTLRSAVEELLASAEAAVDFLEHPHELAARVDLEGLYHVVRSETAETGQRPDEPDRRIGERVGPFRLVGRLGRGGMATVYEAERADGEWSQRVAVKLIRRGLDTEDIIRRFRSERQILSALEHPHIARLIGGGTTEDGLPYLAMELVRGEPITDYCDRRRASIDQRLELFCRVARAVHYAHRNLVVHRDIKPSNILVDAREEPRLLDFGIAKVLVDGDDHRTRTGRHVLTPDYASPEQRLGGRVTTATDIYQLGVLLCVLLTGRRPETQTPSSAVTGGEPSGIPRLVTEDAARQRRSSRAALLRRLCGDLGTIVREALRERPEERYSSVEAMVADIERYLQGRPIVARSGSWMVQATMLMRRKPWLAPGMAVLFAVIGGYWYTIERYAAQLETERNVAHAEAERGQQIQDFLVEVFRSPDP